MVDDNPDHLELIVMALHECCDPIDVATARDGVEALDYLLGSGSQGGSPAPPKLPRVVLLDMKLVGMHGLDVLKALRADPLTAALPVVMHSSSTEKRDIAACYEHGANSYVRKATDYDELRHNMRRVHDFWLRVNESARGTA